MPDIESFPNNSKTRVGSQWMMKFLHGRTSGVYADGENAKVSAVGGEMAVTVSDGDGWISNSEGDGVAWWFRTQKETGSPMKLTVDYADGVLNRIDRVVVTWETTNYEALPNVTILKGTPATVAQPPALVNNNIQRQISLAQIIVKAGTASLKPDMIKDERLDKSVCGVVTNDVEIDTSSMQERFNQFMEGIEDVLDVNTAGKLFNMINDLSSRMDLIENLFFNKIVSNKFQIKFDTLDNVTTNGVWNKSMNRIEC